MGSKKIPVIRASLVFASITHLMGKVARVFDKDQPNVLQVKTELPKRIYCVLAPDLISSFFVNSSVGTTKPPGLLPREDWLMRESLVTDTGKHWKNKRTVMGPPFLPKNLDVFFEHIAPATERLLGKIDSYREANQPFDVHLEMRRCTVDFSLQMFFSEQLADDDLDKLTVNVTYLESDMPEQIPLWLPLPANLNFKKESIQLRDFCASLIAKRRNLQVKPGDYLDHLLAVEDIELHRSWNNEEIVDQMLAVFLGASAIATPLTWTTYQLSHCPEVCRAMLAEFNAVSPASDMVSYQASKEMTYFEYAIKETMRLYPTFWGNIRYNEKPLEIDGYSFPAKSTFLLLRYFANRHPHYWQNPQAFDPLRFSPDNPHRIRPNHYLPFASGPRTCLGIHMSIPIIKMILGSVFRRFELFNLTTAPNGQPKIVFNYGLYPQKPIMLSVQNRVAPALSNYQGV